ncbi:TonB family protein [Sphingomonas oligoaromativorans]|uniref:TonB family protein n=1 Tax=Sphingomonas oligoaromativorans TaxID=575322 RepID=UPI00142459E9|nr:TonB family protein [Sphingomonas oligoaromativorans]NIJ31937.1 TonB family protein [Sphingomonas oligoaromativorans]
MLKRNWRLLALAPLLATPVWAHGAQTRDSNPAITVQAQHETVGEWSQRVGRSLSGELAYPSKAGPDDNAQGLAKVSFRCSDDGRPGEIAVLSSSGSHDLDRAAMRAVKRIPTLHPLPDGIGHDRAFQAWVAFALDEDSLKRMTNAAHRDADRMNARVERDRAGHQVAGNALPIVIAAN